VQKLAVDPAIAEIVNEMDLGWKAGENEMFVNMSFEAASRLMGVKKPNVPVKRHVKRFSSRVWADLPTDFDSRKAWPHRIGPVMNQAECGSCWAFGAAEAISDRIAIAKNETYVQLAPLDLVSCDTNDNGCEGGDPGSAWDYAQSSGLVTESCGPYGTWEGGPIPTCPADQQPCLNFVNTPACPAQCASGSSWQSAKHYISSSYSLTSVNDMAADIQLHGPIEVAFDVYQDFLSYKSGVYQQTSGSLLGGHAVKMIGWGVENGLPYWLCQNSWTTSWGDGGYFKILKGQDECGIEDGAVAGLP